MKIKINNIIKHRLKFIFFLIFLLMIQVNKKINILEEFPQNTKDIKDIKVCLCMLGKKENPYAKETVQYYKNIGYNHIYIYDNNDIGDEKLEDVLYNEINNNFVTIIDVRGLRKQQCSSYKHCYEKYNKYYDWLSFFDFDEFLYIKNNKTVQEFLSDEKYKKCANVKINWLSYTDNDLIYYEDKSVLERFKSYRTDLGINVHTKSTVRGGLRRNYWTSYHNSHTSEVKFTSCNTIGEIVPYNLVYIKPNYDFAYLKHFSTKTIEEFCLKLKRGYPAYDVVNNKKLLNRRLNDFFSVNKKTKEKIDFIKNFFKIDFE